MKDFFWSMVFFLLFGVAVSVWTSVCAFSVAKDAWEKAAVDNGVGVFVVDKYGKASFQWVKPQPTTQAK